MNETLLWLLYCVSGFLAFATVYRWRWHLALAIVSGGLLTGIGWAMLFRATDAEKRPEWVALDASLNITFGLIFALFGAAIAWWLLRRRSESSD